MQSEPMEGRLRLGLLLDYYGALLTENRRELLKLTLDDDLSLGEISEQKGISRQGVRDALIKGRQQLNEFEKKVGFVRRDEQIIKLLTALKKELSTEEVGVRTIFEELDELLGGAYGV